VAISGLTCRARCGGGAKRRSPVPRRPPPGERRGSPLRGVIPVGPCKNITETTAPPAPLLPGELNINSSGAEKGIFHHATHLRLRACWVVTPDGLVTPGEPSLPPRSLEMRPSINSSKAAPAAAELSPGALVLPSSIPVSGGHVIRTKKGLFQGHATHPRSQPGRPRPSDLLRAAVQNVALVQ